MADFLKQKTKSHYTGIRRKKPVIEHEALSQSAELEIEDSAKSDTIAIEKQSKKSTQSVQNRHMSWFFLPISGIIGGFIAVGFWIGIQKAGFLPSFLLDNRAVGEKALQIAEIAKDQTEKTVRQMERVLQEINTLKAEFSSFSSQYVEIIQGDEISQEKSGKVFEALEKKVGDLEKYIQTLVEISKDMKTALFVGQSNAKDLAALKQQLEIMQEKTITKSDGTEETNTALFVAVNSLKNAIERGGSYVNELKILQQLSPSIDGLDLLQKTAAIGLPNPAQLSVDFASVADAIVGTQNIVTADAGFFERMLAWLKGLIILRPVGNVKGMTLGAITARMEIAIQVGDYEKALAEWQTLPQSAKNISVNFVHQLETYIAIRNLLQQLLVSAQQKSVKATKM
ncbi:COG4223 family protein [Bartonella sp. B35(2025)]